MKFYISAKGIKRVTISNGGKGSAKGTTTAVGTPTTTGGSGRRISLRTVLPVVLVLGIVLPFIFVRVAILVLESATFCSSLGNFLSNSNFFSSVINNFFFENNCLFCIFSDDFVKFSKFVLSLTALLFLTILTKNGEVFFNLFSLRYLL